MSPETGSSTLPQVHQDLLSIANLLIEANAKVRKERAIVPLERKVQRALARAFRAQGAAFLRRLAKYRSRFGPKLTEAYLSESVDDREWGPLWDAASQATWNLLIQPLEAAVTAALQAGASAALEDLGPVVSFTLKNPRAVEYLHGYGAALVAKIDDVTRSEIRRILEQGAANGWSYDHVAREITARFQQMAAPTPQLHIQSRAHLIAVTELGNAYEAGNMLVARGLQSSGVKVQKSWLAVGDRRVDPLCASNAAAGWIPLDHPFPSGHDRPTAHPACRCTLLYQQEADAK